jgi:hypothetical protein
VARQVARALQQQHQRNRQEAIRIISSKMSMKATASACGVIIA